MSEKAKLDYARTDIRNDILPFARAQAESMLESDPRRLEWESFKTLSIEEKLEILFFMNRGLVDTLWPLVRDRFEKIEPKDRN